MLIEVNSETYKKHFPINPTPFISDSFIELNKSKVERVIRLIEDREKPAIGLIAGVKNEILLSPFSSPFGGFHFSKENIYISEIEQFLKSLQSYIIYYGLKKIELVLPPDIYHLSFNAKTVNSLLRTGFHLAVPDITNWVNLQHFNGAFTQKNSSKYYRQSVRNKLSFNLVNKNENKKKIYELICQNRAKFGRPIYMTFEDILNTNNLWPVDFFEVNSENGSMVASAILYRSHSSICHGVFWGDNDIGRPLRAMDFLAFNLWNYYKKAGFDYIDLGISTEAGNPNESLLRFKESHESVSSLRFKFFWQIVQD